MAIVVLESDCILYFIKSKLNALFWLTYPVADPRSSLLRPRSPPPPVLSLWSSVPGLWSFLVHNFCSALFMNVSGYDTILKRKSALRAPVRLFFNSGIGMAIPPS